MKYLGIWILLFTTGLWAQDKNRNKLDFEAKIFEKDEIYKLATYLGKKKIIINFFASWCVPCVEEIPKLNALKSKYPQHEFIAINAAESTSAIKKFLSKYPLSFVIIEDPESKLASLFRITDVPTTLIIDVKGKIIYRSEIPPSQI